MLITCLYGLVSVQSVINGINSLKYLKLITQEGNNLLASQNNQFLHVVLDYAGILGTMLPKPLEYYIKCQHC